MDKTPMIAQYKLFDQVSGNDILSLIYTKLIIF